MVGYHRDPEPPRRGTCPWCGRHDQFLFFLPHHTDGQYHADMVCGRCKDEFQRDLKARIHRQWMEEVGR